MDSVAGAWMAIEGTEIVNAARTRRYILNGYGPPGLRVEGDCDCPEDQLRALIGCDDEPWDTPATDFVPWYDPAIPESADFAGFYPTSFEGLESTYTREVTPITSGGGGGILGRLRVEPRTMIWRGYLFGRTCCAVAYGLRWLTSMLRQSKCGSECGGERLDLLICCPPTGTPNDDGVNARFRILPPDTTSDEFNNWTKSSTYNGGTWTLSYGGYTTIPFAWDEDDTFVVLAALEALPSIGVGNIQVSGGTFPTPFELLFYDVLGSRPITGLTVNSTGITGPDSPYVFTVVPLVVGAYGTSTGESCGCTTLVAPGIPADDDAFRTLYNVGLVEGPLVLSQRSTSGRCGCSTIMEVEFSMVAGNPHLYRQPVVLADCATFDVAVCPTWVKVASPAECPAPTICDPVLTPVATDPLCAVATLPPVFDVAETCFCEPLAPTDTCIAVPASTYGLNFQGAPVFQVYAGSSPLRSTQIRLVENPLAQDCDVVTEDECSYCDSITIRYIPAFSTLTVDGVNRRVTIETPGGDVQSGEQFMVGNYSWPVLECVDYCVCVTVDALSAAEDACFSLSVYPSEM